MTQMERYIMFLHWKNQYCQNDYIIQGHLQIQCNSYQITNGIFHRIRTKNFIIYMGIQKTQRAEAILRETEQKKSGSLTSNYTTQLQSSRQYGTDTKTEIQTSETR